MPATTPRWAIPYPIATESPNGPAQMGALALALDDVAKDSSGLLSARPTSSPGSPGKAGRYYLATDNGVLYRDNGTGWNPINANKADEAWVAMTLLNSWTVYTSGSVFDPAYLKDAAGVVHLRGGIVSGSVGSAVFTSKFATLPVGYRPTKDMWMPIVCGDPSSFGRVDILTNGDCFVRIGVDGTGWHKLDSIQFPVT